MTASMHPDQQQLLVWASVAFSAFVASLVVAAVMAHLAATRKK
ncbi:hypothetical protein OK142_01045 [Agrobacterium sp. BT-220-3]|nr:hypothetical protein [Agrobacterium sp. BT-220-3]